MDVKALYMYSWELLAGPREKFEHGTLGCNVYYSICCFLLVIYLHLHSSGSFSPGRHNLAPTLMELDFKKITLCGAAEVIAAKIHDWTTAQPVPFTRHVDEWAPPAEQWLPSEF
jgi:hypothetical protein